MNSNFNPTYLYKNAFGDKKALRNEDYLDKITRILKWLPKEINSVLDVGCGDGSITNFLAEHLLICGTDISPVGPSQLRDGIKAVISSPGKLPFDDNEFDLVMSHDVLEHLPLELLTLTVSEITRVARKWILVSVPHNENLEYRMTHCNRCLSKVHIWGHISSFTRKDLLDLFGESMLVREGNFGATTRFPPKIILRLSQNLGDRWMYDDTHPLICPCCGHKIKRIPLKLVGRVLYGIGLRFAYHKTNPFWIMMLFKKASFF